MNTTAVILNWMQCRLTLGAIKNFRQYYPDMPLLVIDNGTKDEDMQLFDIWYKKNKEDVLDTDIDKLRKAQKKYNFKLIELPENIGQGSAVDEAVGIIDTDFMFVMDNDARLLDGNLFDEFMTKMEDDVYAVGIAYPDTYFHQTWVGLQCGVFRLAPIKKYHLSFGNLAIVLDEKECVIEPGSILDVTLLGVYPDRTRKIQWKSFTYPRIEKMSDRILHLKVARGLPEEIERFNKWIDG